MNLYNVTQSVTPAEWDGYVAFHPDATAYHQSAWCDVVTRSFGHDVIRLEARDGSGRIAGVLPLVHMKSLLFGNFLVSVPFFNYGGILCDDAAAGEALLAAARRIRVKKAASHVELRHLGRQLEGLPTRYHKVTMVLDLEDDPEVQWKNLDAKVRNQVRKAERSGLRTITGGMELLDGFYEVFCRNMRDLGTPVYGKEFFRNVLQAFPDTSRIISIQLNQTTVASGILTRFRETLEVPWASSVRDYREMCPNNLLYWEAIRFAIGNGSTSFDFGRSTPGEGTYRFKKQWGARPVQLNWQYLLEEGAALPELNPSNPKYQLMVKTWQRLPVWLATIFGPRIVRSIP